MFFSRAPQRVLHKLAFRMSRGVERYLPIIATHYTNNVLFCSFSPPIAPRRIYYSRRPNCAHGLDCRWAAPIACPWLRSAPAPAAPLLFPSSHTPPPLLRARRSSCPPSSLPWSGRVQQAAARGCPWRSPLAAVECSSQLALAVGGDPMATATPPEEEIQLSSEEIQPPPEEIPLLARRRSPLEELHDEVLRARSMPARRSL